jgi:hypothetical protein
MSGVVATRGLAGCGSGLRVESRGTGTRPTDGKTKAPTSGRRMWLICLKFSDRYDTGAAGASTDIIIKSMQTAPPASSSQREDAMTMQDDDILIRPGRIKDRSRGANKAKSFVGEVMRAAKKAGHTGEGFARVGGTKHRSTFGRARQAALALSRKKFSRRVVVMARIVRHQGKRFRAAPLARHAAYLERDGVTRDGRDAKMFNLAPDDADAKAFAERCEDDRHHFRFTISPDDATDMEDLRAFSRDLTKDVARDLGTKLDWVAVDHWNTDNPTSTS